MADGDALDSAWTGLTTLAAVTPAGMLFGVTPAGAPEGWGRLDTLEAVSGLDVSDRVDTSASGGAVAATIETVQTHPSAPVRRGLDAVAEGQTEVGKGLGWLPSWWRPWMTKAAWALGLSVAALVLLGPYVAPLLLAARKGSAP